MCHLAFLNSKISTYFLKVLNPKFTVSAGYIGKIPVANGILDNQHLAVLAAKCINLKREYLSSKLPNYEFAHDDYNGILDVDTYIEYYIRKDIFNQYRRYIYEQEIDKCILEKYRLSDIQLKEYYKMMGGQISYEGNIPNLRRIDKLLVSTLNESCQSVSRKLNGFIIGTENQIDMISYMYSLSPKDITKFIIANARLLTGTMNIYKRDLIHKLILKVSGVEFLSRVQLNIVPDSDVIFGRMVESYPSLVKQLNISVEVIREIIRNIHVKCFNNKPILKL